MRAYLKVAKPAVNDIAGGRRGYEVLAAAARGEAGTQLALAQRLGVDRTVMTYLLDDMESCGLIERQPDPADRRARRVVATEHGLSVLASVHKHLRAAEDHVLSGLEEPDRTQFRTLLHRLASRANAEDPVVNACAIVDECAESGQVPVDASPVAVPSRRRR